MKNRILTIVLLLSSAVLLLIPSVQAGNATVTVTPSNLNGWVLAPYGSDVPIEFVSGIASIGSGSIQFGPLSPLDPNNKFIMYAPYLGSATDFLGISYDFYVGSLNASHFYLNIYTDDGNPATTNWYDCRFDYVPTGALGWNTFNVTGTTAPTVVTAKGGAVCPATFGGLIGSDTIFRVAINGGQSNATDPNLTGGFDNIIIATNTDTTTYDFEPPSAEELAGNIIAYINQLNSDGVLNKGQTNALTNKVENALKKLDKGQTAEAINKLNELIVQANDLASDGVLSPEQVQQLTDLTNLLIAAISS